MTVYKVEFCWMLNLFVRCQAAGVAHPGLQLLNI